MIGSTDNINASNFQKDNCYFEKWQRVSGFVLCAQVWNVLATQYGKAHIQVI